MSNATGISQIFQKLKSNKNERILNTHILQFVFLGSTGFRFPFHRSVTDTASGHGLYLSIWQSGNMLINVGFKIRYITTDVMEHRQTKIFLNFYCQSLSLLIQNLAHLETYIILIKKFFL